MRLYFLAVLLVGLPFLSHAEPGVDPAVKLQKTIDTGLNVFFEPGASNVSGEEKRKRIAALLSESYDINILLRRAMGRNWKKLSPEEQEEVFSLFQQLVVKVSYDRLSSGLEKPEIRFNETIYESDLRVRIPIIIFTEGIEYNVVYRMAKAASGWQIIDIVAEEISFVSNYRQQFNDHFRRKDGAALIKKLKEMLTNDNLTSELTL